MATYELLSSDPLSERARKLVEIVFTGAEVPPEYVAAAIANVGRALEIYAGNDARLAPRSPGIVEAVDPGDWARHRFGLSPERWRALAGKAYWITGAGTGYGRAVAIALGVAGARLALTGRRARQLEAVAAEIRQSNAAAEIIALPMDVTDAAAATAGVARLRQRFGELEGLVCCAALPGNPGPVLGMAEADLRRVLDVNVLGQMVPCRAALPSMLACGRGRVLLYSSECAWGFPPGLGVYDVTKAAVNGLGAALANEVAAMAPNADVQVNVVDPGQARTEMNQVSPESPFSVCSITLTLLAQAPNGPSGRFFHRDGRHLSYGYAQPWPRPLG